MAAQKNNHKPEPLSIALALVAIVGVAACAVITWLRLQPSTYQDAVAAEVSQKQQEALDQKKQAAVPELLLNQDYNRQGPDVTVDPNKVGKTDPFK
jgi:hypothetical protein